MSLYNCHQNLHHELTLHHLTDPSVCLLTANHSLCVAVVGALASRLGQQPAVVVWLVALCRVLVLLPS